MGERCNVDGIKELKFSQPSGPTFHYEAPTNVTFGDQPHLRDPLDKKYVSVKQSVKYPLAEEAAFASRDIPSNTVFVLYGGRLLNQEENEIMTEREIAWAKTQSLHRDDPVAVALWMYR